MAVTIRKVYEISVGEAKASMDKDMVEVDFRNSGRPYEHLGIHKDNIDNVIIMLTELKRASSEDSEETVE